MGVQEQERPAKLRLGEKKKQPQRVVMAGKTLAAMAKAHESEALYLELPKSNHQKNKTQT